MKAKPKYIGFNLQMLPIILRLLLFHAQNTCRKVYTVGVRCCDLCEESEDITDKVTAFFVTAKESSVTKKQWHISRT